MQVFRSKDSCSGITLVSGHSDGEMGRETHSSTEIQSEQTEVKQNIRVYRLYRDYVVHIGPLQEEWLWHTAWFAVGS